MRYLIWFSAGVASAVAAKITLKELKAEDGVVIAYCDTGSEHPDNIRFIKDCEKWLNYPVNILKSKDYKDTWDVWEKTRYLNGLRGARCTIELKKVPRFKFQKPGDRHVLGFTVDEGIRLKTFIQNNWDTDISVPLISHKLTKANCLALVQKAGIELPVMYKLGYVNNNCIGCVKGGAGYWNKIRLDFPEVFDRMSKLERDIKHAVVRVKNVPVFLDELDPTIGNLVADTPSCSLMCSQLSDHLNETTSLEVP